MKDFFEENEMFESNYKKIEFLYDSELESDIVAHWRERDIKKVQCKKCGCDEFMVGSGKYITVIKCKICKYVVRIHEG